MKFYLKKDQWLLTFSEILNLNINGNDSNDILKSLQLELI